MRGWVTTAALGLALCACEGGGGDGPDGDAGFDVADLFDWTDSIVPDTGDVPDDGTVDPDGDPVVTGPGQFRTHLTVPVSEPGVGLIIRVSYPAEDAARHVEGAPVVVMAPGGHGVGSLGYDEVDPITEQAGVVVVKYLLPGGGDGGGNWSSGTYDYRGPNCREATRDVLRYAMGEIADEEGWHLEDRVPWADTTNVGVLGMSHGGNLVLTTLAEHHAELGDLDWFASWESPVGDQYVTVELGGLHPDPSFNPYYEPGSCADTSCPWPGMRDVLEWDSSYSHSIEDPLDGTLWAINGVFFLDTDGNGVRGDTEFMFEGIPGPGEEFEGDHLPWVYFSTEMADVIEHRESALFPFGLPQWMAEPADVDSYWIGRDGSLAIGDVHAAMPDLLVMVVGSRVDHVQSQPDHPHLRTHLTQWIDAGHGWVRLNPDAAYVAELSGLPVGDIPELSAGAQLPWPDAESHLVPAAAGAHLTAAAAAELSDRVRAEDTSADFDATLY